MAQDYHSEEEVLGKAYDSHLMKRLLAYIKPYRKYVIFAILMNIIVAALGPLRPYLTKIAIDDYIVRFRLSRLNCNKFNPVCQPFVPGGNTVFSYLLHTIPRAKNTL